MQVRDPRQQLTLEKRDGMWGDDGYWYYSPAAAAVKWAALAAIVLLFFIFFAGGYLHAQRRMKKGLPPMAYHRWFISRRQRARFEPHLWQPQNQFTFYQTQDNAYNMHPVPPPAYNPNLVPPPTYQPPVGASKVDPSQLPQDMPARPAEAAHPGVQHEMLVAGVPGPSASGEGHPPTDPNPPR